MSIWNCNQHSRKISKEWSQLMIFIIMNLQPHHNLVISILITTSYSKAVDIAQTRFKLNSTDYFKTRNSSSKGAAIWIRLQFNTPLTQVITPCIYYGSFSSQVVACIMQTEPRLAGFQPDRSVGNRTRYCQTQIPIMTKQHDSCLHNNPTTQRLIKISLLVVRTLCKPCLSSPTVTSLYVKDYSSNLY